MRIAFRLLVAGLVILAAGCGGSRQDAPPVVRWEFAGLTALGEQSQAPVLQEVLSLGEAEAAGASLSTNLTRAFWSLLSGRTNVPADVVGNSAPLMRELLRASSLGGVWSKATGGKDYALSARLDAARAGSLRDAVVRFLASAGVTNTESLSLSATNGWVTVASSPDVATRLRADAGTSASLLKLDIDFDAVRDAWPLKFLAPPRVSLVAIATNKIVRTNARLCFREPINMDLDAWRPPMAMIYDPIVNFTAARGLKSFLEKSEWFQELKAGEAPNQVFIWDQALVAFQKFFAAPMADPAKFVDAVAARIGPMFDTNAPVRPVLGDLNYSTNRHSILIQQLAGALPILGPLRTNGTEYVMGGLFMTTRTTNPPPTALTRQLERPNLIAYDWEITAESAKHWRAIRQLEDITFLRNVIPGTAPGQLWFLAAVPKMGNTVTEVSRVSPTEWELVRSSPAGLSGFELVQLTRWIDEESRGMHPRGARPGTKLVPAAGPRPRPSKPAR